MVPAVPAAEGHNHLGSGVWDRPTWHGETSSVSKTQSQSKANKNTEAYKFQSIYYKIKQTSHQFLDELF